MRETFQMQMTLISFFMISPPLPPLHASSSPITIIRNWSIWHHLVKTFTGITGWTIQFLHAIMKSLPSSNQVFCRWIQIKRQFFYIMPLIISSRNFILGIIEHCFCYHNLINLKTRNKAKNYIYKPEIWIVLRRENWSAKINFI